MKGYVIKKKFWCAIRKYQSNGYVNGFPLEDFANQRIHDVVKIWEASMNKKIINLLI